MELTHSVKHQNTGEQVKCSTNIEDSIGACVAAYGEEVCYSIFKAGVTAQVNSRLGGLTHGKNPKSAEEALKAMEDYKPRLWGSRTGKSKVDKLAELVAGMTQEELQAGVEKAKAIQDAAEAEDPAAT